MHQDIQKAVNSATSRLYEYEDTYVELKDARIEGSKPMKNNRAYSQDLRSRKPRTAKDIYDPSREVSGDRQNLTTLSFKVDADLKLHMKLTAISKHMKMAEAGQEAVGQWVEANEENKE